MPATRTESPLASVRTRATETVAQPHSSRGSQGFRSLSAAWALVLLSAAAAIVRIAYVLAFAGTRLSDDETSFWAIAGNLARGQGFSYQGRATAWRPPLYTAVLGLARWTGASVREVQIAQAVLGITAVLATYLCTRLLTRSTAAALVAAAVAAVYPPFIYFSGRLLSENVAIPVYVLALALSVGWLQGRGARWAVACGAAWGLAVLARPTAIPVAIVCVAAGAATALAGRRAGTGVRRLAETAAVVIAAAVLVTPWVVRNASAVGGPVPVTSNEGFALWAANRRDTRQLENVLDDHRYPGMQDYAVYGRSFPGITALAQAKHFDFATAGEAAQDRFFRNLAVHDIRADPVRFATRTLARAGAVLAPAPDYASQTTRTSPAAKVVLWVTSGPLIVAGVAGLLLLARRRPRRATTWFVVGTAAVTLGLVATHVPYIRYRVDGLDPVLIVAAGCLVDLVVHL